MRGIWFTLLAALTASTPLAAAERFDVVVVGAGIGGLTTALRATEQGLRVGVVDMASLFGGHALMSTGGLCIVNTPLQKEKGIADSSELAYADFIRQGQDADQAMVKLYVERSLELIYDWLTGLGVQFTAVTAGGVGETGNSANRFHMNPKLGYGLVSPIYRECMRKGVTFYRNTQVTALETRDGRIGGVKGTNLRTSEAMVFEGQAVVLATGGYESNMSLVRKYWPRHLGRVPERVVLGSGTNSTGSGLTLARSAGGALRNMDHQWIYPRGIPDPAHLSEGRGVYVMVADAISLNKRGQRFMDEMSATTRAVRAVMAQPGGTHWTLFDENGANTVFAVGMDWQDKQKVRREIVDNEAVVKTAATLEEVARKAGLPPGEVKASVDRWNRAVESGVDPDFKRQLSIPLPGGRSFKVSKIDTGPFHLMQIYSLSRKSMGGICVDLNGRVLNREGKPVAGLYAVGETTGEGGLNGRAALEGTFLGPSIVQGHMAAAHLAAALRPATNAIPSASAKPTAAPGKTVAGDCRECHQMDRLTAAKRPGYWHFEKLHTLVAARGYECKSCHAEMSPYRAGAHKADNVAQIDVCITCHLVRE